MADNQQFVTEFARNANHYVELVTTPAGAPYVFAKRLLGSLSRLYTGALLLPHVDDVDPNHDFRRSSDGEWQNVYKNISDAFGERIHYWSDFDPIYPRDGSAKITGGSLGDDCADIHRDIIGPLVAFNSGDTEHLNEIIWEWARTPFESHWGIHATQAINALHWIVFDHGIPNASDT